MQKLKILPPTMRENKRYLLLKTVDKKKVEKSILNFIGALGWAKTSPHFIEDKTVEAKGLIILSINHDHLDEIRTALELSGIHCLRVSGTIKTLKAKFLK